MDTLECEECWKGIDDRTLDFVIGNPAQYVELETSFGASRIAAVEFANGPSPSQAIGSVIFIRSGRRDITTLGDVQGHRLAAISPELFGGFQLGWRELVRHGIDPFDNGVPPLLTGEPVDNVFDIVLPVKPMSGSPAPAIWSG